MTLNLEEFYRCLGKSLVSCEVPGLFHGATVKVTRSSHLGFVELKDVGVTMIVHEAGMLFPQASGVGAKDLVVTAFHFYSNGADGYHQYGGTLPSGIQFGEDRRATRRKLGTPIDSGGGNFSPTLRQTIRSWDSYSYRDARFSLDFDTDSSLWKAMLYIHGQAAGG